MKTEFNHLGLNHRLITELRTEIGYLQVLEYTLQDNSYLHIVQYHYNNILEENNIIPKVNCKSFYREKNKALQYAQEIGVKLLKQYDL